MDPQLLTTQTVDGKLDLTWAMAEGVQGVVILVATNSAYTENRRLFLLPPVIGCQLDVGKGDWYIRVGVCIGSVDHGRVYWSGIRGPVPVVTSKEVVPQGTATLKIHHTQGMANGVRFHTGRYDPCIVLVEQCADRTFPAGTTKWNYQRELGHGWIECMGLEYPNLYSFRLNLLECKEFPKDTIITALEGVTLHKKGPTKLSRTVGLGLAHSSDHASSKAEAALIHEAKTRPSMYFASHTDYVRYQAGLAKSRGAVERT